MKNKEIGRSYFNLQEIDRQRIARELHDSSLQDLTHVIQEIELAELYMEQDIIKSKLELFYVKKEIKEIVQNIRNTIFDLRPMQIDDIGMRETLILMIENFQSRTNIVLTYEIDELGDISKNLLLDIYRIVQELIGNAIKHSKGKKIFFQLCNEFDELTICVMDNGIGFDYDLKKNENNSHFGLQIIEERIQICNGTIEVDSNINKGTKIFVKIPKK